MSLLIKLFRLCLAIPLVGSLALAQSQPKKELSQDILAELIAIRTSDSGRQVTTAIRAIERRLREAGFAEQDIRIGGAHPDFQNLVVRYRGTGQLAPVLLLAHLDVVEALPSDWTMEPFQLTQTNGFFYGRGVVDDKGQAAAWIANLIRYKEEGFRPQSDIIVALTAGEESGLHNGVDWIVRNHPDWIQARVALNEGGEGVERDGRPLAHYVQAAEKVFYSIKLESRDKGGHSSVPHGQNPIYAVSEALLRIREYQFPPRVNDITSLYYQKTASLEQGSLAKAMRSLAKNRRDAKAMAVLSQDPIQNALLRTTCVATQTMAGHAENALPQTATAIVNCRLLPSDDPAQVLSKMKELAANPDISVTPLKDARISSPSIVTPALLKMLESTSGKFWPNVPVIPVMSTGATDSRALRIAGIPCFGVSGFFLDAGDNRQHGKDERISVKAFFQGQQFLYDFVKRLSSEDVGR